MTALRLKTYLGGASVHAAGVLLLSELAKMEVCRERKSERGREWNGRLPTYSPDAPSATTDQQQTPRADGGAKGRRSLNLVSASESPGGPSAEVNINPSIFLKPECEMRGDDT